MSQIKDISLKEEMENLDSFNLEKTNKNKINNKNNDDEEFILLKRKRNEKII